MNSPLTPDTPEILDAGSVACWLIAGGADGVKGQISRHPSAIQITFQK
jgi:hypothetical protein